jgi:hypothetical protein
VEGAHERVEATSGRGAMSERTAAVFTGGGDFHVEFAGAPPKS